MSILEKWAGCELKLGRLKLGVYIIKGQGKRQKSAKVWGLRVLPPTPRDKAEKEDCPVNFYWAGIRPYPRLGAKTPSARTEVILNPRF